MHTPINLFIVMLAIWGTGLVQQSDAQSITQGDVEKLAGGFQFTEGPVWHPDGYLLFSDIPANKIYQWAEDQDVKTFREDSGNSNGLTFDRVGNLLAAEHGNRRVSLTNTDGEISTLVETYDEKQFNSPNDLVVRTDGMIFFTDPPYGLGNREKELEFHGIYRYTPGEDNPVLLNSTFDRPNGLAFSPDESILYVADTARNLVQSYQVDSNGNLTDGSQFAEVANPDGMKVDQAGRVFVTSRDGVVVFDANGNKVETIVVPEIPANIAFGGEENKTLFITARTGLYAVAVNTPGILVWTGLNAVEDENE